MSQPETQPSRCLVTGASGQLGASLVRLLLNQGHEVAILVRSTTNPWRLRDVLDQVTLVHGDLADLASAAQPIQDFRAQIVFHLAWHGIDRDSRNSAAQITTNLTGSLQLLERVLEAGAQCWVGVGSQAEYGPHDGRLHEGVVPNPANLYGLAKLCLGRLAIARCELAGVRPVWLRLLATYGPADDERRLIPYIIRTLLAGKSPELSAGTQRWDYLYVEDAAQALLAAAFSQASGVFNLASEEAWTVRRIAEYVRESVNPKLGIQFGNDGAARDLEADTSRLREATGWRPVTPLADGLHRTIQWYVGQTNDTDCD